MRSTLKIYPGVQLLNILNRTIFPLGRFPLHSMSWRREGTSVVVGWMAGMKWWLMALCTAEILTVKKLGQNCEEDIHFCSPLLGFPSAFSFPSSTLYQYCHGHPHHLLYKMGPIRQSLMFFVFLFSFSYPYWCVFYCLILYFLEPKSAFSPPLLLSIYTFIHSSLPSSNQPPSNQPTDHSGKLI